MEEANIVMRINKTDTIPKSAVTPAEVVILSHKDHGHFNNVGGFPVTELKVTGEAKKHVWDELEGIFVIPAKGAVKRSDGDEILRLKRIYGKGRVEACFPGASPTLPQTFNDIASHGGPCCATKEEVKKPA